MRVMTDFRTGATANNDKFMFIVYGAYCITGVHYGTGLHVKDMEPGHVTKAMQVRSRWN